MYAVTGITGKIGGVAANALLEAGLSVRALDYVRGAIERRTDLCRASVGATRGDEMSPREIIEFGFERSRHLNSGRAQIYRIIRWRRNGREVDYAMSRAQAFSICTTFIVGTQFRIISKLFQNRFATSAPGCSSVRDMLSAASVAAEYGGKGELASSLRGAGGNRTYDHERLEAVL